MTCYFRYCQQLSCDWVVAILALHMTNANIPQRDTVFENFYEFAKEYRSLLEKHSFE